MTKHTRKMRARAMIAACLAPLMLITPAHSTDNRYTILGAGGASCGKWISDQAMRSFFESWLLGYLTAVNVDLASANVDGDVTGNVDSDGVYLWITNYCQTHPLDDISTAAIELVIDLELHHRG